MLTTVFSRSTTTPRRRPSLGAFPIPTTRRVPESVPFVSAMMQEILVVPMSSPTYIRVACAMGPLTSCELRSTAVRLRSVPGRFRRGHDHLIVEAEVHHLRRHPAMLQIRQHHPQRGELAHPRWPGWREHPRSVEDLQ